MPADRNFKRYVATAPSGVLLVDRKNQRHFCLRSGARPLEHASTTRQQASLAWAVHARAVRPHRAERSGVWAGAAPRGWCEGWTRAAGWGRGGAARGGAGGAAGAEGQIFYSLFPKYGVPPLSSSSVAVEKRGVEQAKAYLAKHLAEPVLLIEFTIAVSLSPFYLLRTCKRTVGLLLHGYLNQLRVEHARVLLRRGEPPAPAAAWGLSIKAISPAGSKPPAASHRGSMPVHSGTDQDGVKEEIIRATLFHKNAAAGL